MERRIPIGRLDESIGRLKLLPRGMIWQRGNS
jgi:hypothetical protein